MALQCKKCGSSNTETRRARDLRETAGGIGLPNAACASTGVVFAIAAVVAGLFNWLAARERSNRPVIICLACGHWEPV